MKRIAITQRQDYVGASCEIRDSIDISWHHLLKKIGVIPILVPNVFQNENYFNEWLQVFKPDGFILSGGNDIGQMECRDKTELFTLNYAEKNKIPALGVCRGMQLMAIRAGAKLKKIHGHVQSRHLVNFDDESAREVNRFHNYQISGKLKDFNCVGHSDDKVLEKIIHKTLPWQGIMWHPERETPYNLDDIKLMKNIFCI